MKKIAFFGFMPPWSVFPSDNIRPQYRGKPAHPAPWMVALLPAIAALGKYEIRVFLAHRSILKPCIAEHEGVVYEGVPSPVPERFSRNTLYFQYSQVVKKPIRKFNPDLVHAFGFETGAALIALRTGYPVSCFIQGIAEDYFPYYIKSRTFIDRHVARWAERRAATRINYMVAETMYAKKWALRSNPDASVPIIPHPLRPDFHLHAKPKHSEVVLSVGTLDDRKGMDVIVKAFAMVESANARLVIVGGGRNRAGLEKLALDLGINDKVEFTGPLDTESVIDRMNDARCFVIASRVDTSPNVVTEAHAIGLPVIGTRGGGIPEMITDGVDGFNVDVDDYKAMAVKMGLLLEDKELARKMGMAGCDKVKVLNDPGRIAQAHAELFDKAIKETNHR